MRSYARSCGVMAIVPLSASDAEVALVRHEQARIARDAGRSQHALTHRRWESLVIHRDVSWCPSYSLVDRSAWKVVT